MRNSKAREIRKAILADWENANPIQKRLYKRLKKVYASLTEDAKQVFIENIKNQLKYEQQ